MAGEVDAEAYKEVMVDPNSQLVELGPGCNDDAIDIIVPTGGGEEHMQADTVSEDDISALGENKHRKRSRSKAKTLWSLSTIKSSVPGLCGWERSVRGDFYVLLRRP